MGKLQQLIETGTKKGAVLKQYILILKDEVEQLAFMKNLKSYLQNSGILSEHNFVLK